MWILNVVAMWPLHKKIIARYTPLEASQLFRRNVMVYMAYGTMYACYHSMDLNMVQYVAHHIAVCNAHSHVHKN